MTSPTYPEHEKMGKIADKSQAIGEFLEWATAERGLHLAEYRTFEDADREVLTVVYTPVQELLAEFFGIDLTAIEREKRAMLDAMRAALGDDA